MAFNPANLAWAGVLGAGALYPAPRVYTYTTTDTVATVVAGTYFTGGELTFRIGEMIQVTASDGKVLLIIDAVNPSWNGGSLVDTLILVPNVNSF